MNIKKSIFLTIRYTILPSLQNGIQWEIIRQSVTDSSPGILWYDAWHQTINIQDTVNEEHSRLTHLWPVVDSIRYRVHRHGMAADEVPSKVYSRQLVEFSCEICNLSNVIADGNEQALSNVRISERHFYNEQANTVIMMTNVHDVNV